MGRIKGAALTAAAAAAFARLYLIPPKTNATPEQVRLVPAW